MTRPGFDCPICQAPPDWWVFSVTLAGSVCNKCYEEAENLNANIARWQRQRLLTQERGQATAELDAVITTAQELLVHTRARVEL